MAKKRKAYLRELEQELPEINTFIDGLMKTICMIVDKKDRSASFYVEVRSYIFDFIVSPYAPVSDLNYVEWLLEICIKATQEFKFHLSIKETRWKIIETEDVYDNRLFRKPVLISKGERYALLIKNKEAILKIPLIQVQKPQSNLSEAFESQL